ncbi:MAG: hypothetical protein IJV65_02045 [Kiritimatiellae bacterium]|nr:hypothetical protein [Kiritimatiellia bacterium]
MTTDAAFDIVRRTLANGRLPHAYLLRGDPRGAAAELAARVASLLLCERRAADPAAAPCGACKSCRAVANGTHPDVVAVEPEKKSRVISIDAIRETFLPWASKLSYLGGWKVGEIFFADRLNDSSANAILKTLEEPPPDTLFLLATDRPGDLLPTIVSRCHRLDLSTGREAPAEPWRSRVGEILAKHSNASALRVAATAARLAALFDEIKGVAESQVSEKLAARRDADPAAALVDADAEKALVSVREKELRGAVYAALEDWYRDVLVLAALRESGAAPGGPGAPDLRFPERRAELEARAARTPARLAARYVEFAGKIREQIEARFIAPPVVFRHWLAWMR